MDRWLELDRREALVFESTHTTDRGIAKTLLPRPPAGNDGSDSDEITGIDSGTVYL
ncbi:hypothetical protein [Planctellipticum variicoloris]|uniref:hypothetical protein n=1 Tax=Planctellipticum variicoloris TaxID=3064265 RepID=UPI002C0E7268|nr:hypothetical protein SH412_003484 [Planctomycetaceae bacterium SH412]HTN01397.1 hypothetical protein [Planctomycetaceae bacterium]